MTFVDPNPSLPKMTISLDLKVDTGLVFVEFCLLCFWGRQVQEGVKVNRSLHRV